MCGPPITSTRPTNLKRRREDNELEESNAKRARPAIESVNAVQDEPQANTQIHTQANQPVTTTLTLNLKRKRDEDGLEELDTKRVRLADESVGSIQYEPQAGIWHMQPGVESDDDDKLASSGHVNDDVGRTHTTHISGKDQSVSEERVTDGTDDSEEDDSTDEAEDTDEDDEDKDTDEDDDMDNVNHDEPFTGETFRAQTIRSLNLPLNATFINCNLHSCNGSGLTLINCAIWSSNFSNSTVRECSYSGCNLTDCAVMDCSFQGSNMTGSVERCSFRGSNVVGRVVDCRYWGSVVTVE